MVSKSKLKAQAKYDAKNTRQIVLKLNLTTDADILKKLDTIENKQGYIKELVRQDFKEHDVLPIDSIKYLVLPTAKKYDLVNIYLFGSYARGEACPESDIDLIIEGGNYTGIIEFISIKESFETALGRKVDLLTRNSLNENSKTSGQIFKNNIAKEQIKIYEKSN